MALDSLTIAQQGIQADSLLIAVQGLLDAGTPPSPPPPRPDGADPERDYSGPYYERFGKGKRGQIEARNLVQQALEIAASEPIEVAAEIADFAAELRAKQFDRDMARLFENQRLLDSIAALEPEIKRLAEIRRIAAERQRDDEDAIAVILMSEVM